MKKMPYIKFNDSAQSLSIMKAKIKLLEVPLGALFVQGKIAPEQFFPRFEKLANIVDLRKMHIEMNNELFKYININEFKQKGNVYLKTIEIALTPKLENITDPNKKVEILTKFHNDPSLGGHCGINRLLNKLRKIYQWENMTYDIRKFAKKLRTVQIK